MKKDNRILLDEKTYISNEVDANKALSKGCIFAAIVVLICWIAYLTNLFEVTKRLLLYINIIFPLDIIVLVSTYFYTKTKMIYKPNFKYVLIFQFLTAVFLISILLPKHTLLLWATAIIIVNHYYNPKASLITFVSVAIMLFFAMFLGMFLGEWDPHLLNGTNILTFNGTEVYCEDTTLAQRIDWLKYLRSIGDNRYIKVFFYYYIPRLLELGIIANICYALSRRTSKLLIQESNEARINEKLASELNVAREIQSSVLPKDFSDNLGSNVFGLMNPEKEVGGDFYDYFYIDQNHLALVIGDVSGKGIPSALFMMKTEALIRSLTKTLKQDTAKIFERINVALCNNNESNMFVTCWLGILNLFNGELHYCNAGHNQPLLINNGMVRFLNDKPGVVLGALTDSEYVERKVKLEKGDRLFLYTDGVTEAQNKDKELFGNDRLFQFTIDNKDKPVKDFIYKLRKEVSEYQGDVEQSDDITMLMCEYIKDIKITESKVFAADVKELDNLFEYSSSLLRLLNFNNRDITLINTALEEVFVNVANYAYDGKGTVEVSLSSDKNKVIFVFKDSGKEFNPLLKEDPNITASSEEREVGGLGIFMVKRIMDEVFYEYTDGFNILTLVKNRK